MNIALSGVPEYSGPLAGHFGFTWHGFYVWLHPTFLNYPTKREARGMLQATTQDPNYADAYEVADFAATLTTAFLLCRELGHNWRPWTARAANGGYERALRCARCNTERWEILTSTGAKVRGHYVYPDGYIHEGLGRIVGDGRDALRLESLSRAIADTEGEKE